MSTLDFNAAVVNVIGFTGIGFFMIAWAHATYSDIMWKRQERDHRRAREIQEWTKIQQARNLFTVNTIK
jgi:hypothetical protein